jgi:hypothetical protein
VLAGPPGELPIRSRDWHRSEIRGSRVACIMTNCVSLLSEGDAHLDSNALDNGMTPRCQRPAITPLLMGGRKYVLTHRAGTRLSCPPMTLIQRQVVRPRRFVALLLAGFAAGCSEDVLPTHHLDASLSNTEDGGADLSGEGCTPPSIAVAVVSSSDTEITLTWPDDNPGCTYEICPSTETGSCSTDFVQTQQSAPGVASARISGLPAGSDYQLGIRAVGLETVTSITARTCQSAKTACAGRCVSLRDDPAHCGACGHACTGNALCSEGNCIPPAKVTALAAGGESSCALMSYGGIACWGGYPGALISVQTQSGEPVVYVSSPVPVRDISHA